MSGHRLIIHVGAPKCGSSALQAALTQRQTFKSELGQTFCYAAVNDGCELILDTALARRSAQSLEGFVRSSDVERLLGSSRAMINGLAERLNQLLCETNVVLSSESWLHEGVHVGDWGLLGRIDAPIDVLAYVRPQAEFLNRSWWQWGAWTTATVQEWIALNERRACWARQLDEWAAIEGVSKVEARLLPQDVIADFFGGLSCPAPPALTVNRSLSAAALRLLQRHRDLRPHAHFAEIDFVLEKAIGPKMSPSPWVLPIDVVAHFIEACREDNRMLLERLSDQDRASMESDPRWWTASAYQQQKIEDAAPQPPEALEIDALAAALARALLEAEHDKAKMRTQLAALSERIGRPNSTDLASDSIKRVA